LVWLPDSEKSLMIRFDKIPQCTDRQRNKQTDGQTDRHHAAA